MTLFITCCYCHLCLRDLHKPEPEESTEEVLSDGAQKLSTTDPAMETSERQEMGVVMSEEEDEAWNTAHLKYQEFRQTCGDLLDPGQ